MDLSLTFSKRYPVTAPSVTGIMNVLEMMFLVLGLYSFLKTEGLNSDLL